MTYLHLTEYEEIFRKEKITLDNFPYLTHINLTKDLNIPVYWINRNHGWSTTKYKTLITKQTLKQIPELK